MEYLTNINKYNTGYEHEMYVGLFLFVYMLTILYFVEKRSVCSRRLFYFNGKQHQKMKTKYKTEKIRKIYLYFQHFSVIVFLLCLYILCVCVNAWCFVSSCAFCVMFFLCFGLKIKETKHHIKTQCGVFYLAKANSYSHN